VLIVDINRREMEDRSGKKNLLLQCTRLYQSASLTRQCYCALF